LHITIQLIYLIINMQATGSSYVGLESTNNSIVMMAMMLTISAEHIDNNIDASNQQSRNSASG